MDPNAKAYWQFRRMRRIRNSRPAFGYNMNLKIKASLGYMRTCLKKRKRKKPCSWVVVRHTFDPSTWEAEADRSLSSQKRKYK